MDIGLLEVLLKVVKKKDDEKIIAHQTINPNITKKLDGFYGMKNGVTVLHEVLEAYIGATDSPGTKPPSYNEIKNKTQNAVNYLNAHKKAMALDPRFIEPNLSFDNKAVYITRFKHDDLLPAFLNPPTVLFKFKKNRK